MYARILVPLDGSATAERGLHEALALAAKLDSHLVLLHVVDDYPVLLDMTTASQYEEGRRRKLQTGEELLARARNAAAEAHLSSEAVLREVSSMRAAEAICAEAARQRCELIVMGTHGRRGFSRLAMGSDAEQVVRESTVPVLLIRCPEKD